MKKFILATLVLVVLPSLFLFSQPKQFVKLVTGNSSIQYLEKASGKPNIIVRDIKMEVEYWSDSKEENVSKKVVFAIVSTKDAEVSKPVIVTNPTSISKDSFDVKHKKMLLTVSVTINAYDKAFTPEYFTIGLNNDSGKIVGIDGGGGIMGVTIQKVPTEAPETKVPEPDGFSFINAVNFDFDGTSASNYVGNLNVFNPNSFYDKPKGMRFGYNLGIMKINFSKNDSLNKSYDYFENAKIHPLDSIMPDRKYLRQYNKLTTVSKNSTWSFYFQPTFSIVYEKNFKLLGHIHTELFVDKWTTNTSISNYQQDTGIFTSNNIDIVKDSLRNRNLFSRSTEDVITSVSTSTVLNFNLGFGLTLEKSWAGGTLFIQPTIGWAFNYTRPQSISKETLYYNKFDKKTPFAHLTRFRLEQKLTTNISAVIGIDVRGKFKGFVDPTYAAFIGADIGLNGIKNLLK